MSLSSKISISNPRSIERSSLEGLHEKKKKQGAKEPLHQPRKSLVIIIRGCADQVSPTRSAEALAGMTYCVRRSLITAQAKWRAKLRIFLLLVICEHGHRIWKPGKFMGR